MPHRYLIKDIAFQAGLSSATVDRVMHDRDGVRALTRLRVKNAIEELARQEQSRVKAGRNFAIDIVMEAPDRFSREVRNAFESEVATQHPALFRPRFHVSERIEPSIFARHLDRICSRGSDGVVVKGPDLTVVRDAVNRLMQAGIAVVTLATDLTGTGRLAYAGIDNEAAGQTAAWLIMKGMGSAKGNVLVTLSSNRFQGEQDRVRAFTTALASHQGQYTVTRISEGFGGDESTGKLTLNALLENPDVCAVYSPGGGNRAVLRAFEQAGRVCKIFVAHDLDPDNRELLARKRIDFVLNHDLKSDARAIYGFLASPGPLAAAALTSKITVHTPFNI